jgi:hypothetical protein
MHIQLSVRKRLGVGLGRELNCTGKPIWGLAVDFYITWGE